MAVAEGLLQSGLCSLASPPCAQPPARPPCPELCDRAQPKAEGSGLLPAVSWQSRGKSPVQLLPHREDARWEQERLSSRRVSHWGRAPCSVASGDSVGRGTWGWRGCCTARLRSPVPGGMLSQSQWQTVVSKSLIYSGNYQLARVPFSR